MENKKVLVVDDDIDILDGVKFILEDDGYTVQILSKGDEISSYVDAFKPDIILLDVLMSGTDGREVCRKLKGNPIYKKIPIIMVSAHPSAAENSLECGAENFIAKPFEVEELLKVIKNQL